MKALVYRGPGKRSLEQRPQPAIELATDAIVKVAKTTICGTDLHIMKGDVPTVTPGRILGHEGVGVIEEVGAAVTSFKAGDRVLISCITSCGKCERCRKGMYSHCIHGGWILGNTIDGTQAEFVRIPFADTSLYLIPETVDDEPLIMLSDIFPTGYECGVLNGKVAPGDIVAIVGAGPIGLATLLTAQLYSPAEVIMIDLDENRLRVAKQLGATQLVNSAGSKAIEKVLELSGDRGVDVAIEAVGVPSTLELCQIDCGSRRNHRKHRCPWQERGAAPREALVAEHHVDHTPGGHSHYTSADEDGPLRPASSSGAHYPSLQALRDHESV